MRRFTTLPLLIVSSFSMMTSAAPKDEETKPSLNFNLPVKTAGGTQLWTDHLWREGYRVQQNSLTGHWRLLNPSNVRQGWGTRKQCLTMLDKMKPASPSRERQHVIILLHGLMRTHHSMKPLEQTLSEDGTVIRFAYASSRSSISDHAAALRSVLEGLPANTTFSFVGHSMGNIVVRHLIGDLNRERDPRKVLPRCQSMVMLGPPNQGAAIARRLAPTGVFGLVTGKGGLELGPKWKEFENKLATPSFPFAIIAGDLDKSGNNPLIGKSSDYVVSAEESRLKGAESFETVPVAHSFLMSDKRAKDITVKFLRKYAPEKKKTESNG